MSDHPNESANVMKYNMGDKGHPYSHPEGMWVTYSKYEALLKERDELKAKFLSAVMNWLDGKITICAECKRACCWQGEFMCDAAKDADIEIVTRRENIARGCGESTDYWYVL